jgi:hypothetical protein
MKLNPIASNMTEITLNDGSRILFSYQTPVAHYKPSAFLYRTSKKWSNTTTRHINKWDIAKWSDLPYAEQPQEYFDGLTQEQTA